MHGEENCVAEDAAADCLKAESALEDYCKALGQNRGIGNDNAYADDYVEQSHKWNKICCNRAYSLYAADDNNPDYGSQDNSGDKRGVKAGSGKVVYGY